MKKVHGIVYFDLLAVVHATKSALKVRKQGLPSTVLLGRYAGYFRSLAADDQVITLGVGDSHETTTASSTRLEQSLSIPINIRVTNVWKASLPIMIAHSQLAPLPSELPFRIVSKTIGQGAYAWLVGLLVSRVHAKADVGRFKHQESSTPPYIEAPLRSQIHSQGIRCPAWSSH